MATLTHIRKHSTVHPAALIPRNCRLTNTGCSVPLQNQSEALPPVRVHSGLRSSLRCAQLLHTLIKYLSSRSEEKPSELQSLMRKSYAVFCLKKNKTTATHIKPY